MIRYNASKLLMYVFIHIYGALTAGVTFGTRPGHLDIVGSYRLAELGTLPKGTGVVLWPVIEPRTAGS